MSQKKKKSYEEEKQDILKHAEEHLGSEYIEKLEKMSQSEEQDNTKQDYSITVNHEGAFYAC